MGLKSGRMTMWTLTSHLGKINVTDHLVFGKHNFPDDDSLAAHHAELRTEGTRLLIRDLGASSGIYIDGERIPKGATAELRSGQEVRFGNTRLRVGQRHPKKLSRIRKSTTEFSFSPEWTTAFILAVAWLLQLAAPDMDWGQSIGLKFTTILLTSLLLATICGALVGHFVSSFVADKRQSLLLFLALTAAITWGLNAKILSELDGAKPFVQEMIASKAHYFCLEHFRERLCVSLVNSCPRCLDHIDQWQRDKMAERLTGLKPAELRRMLSSIPTPPSTPKK